MAVWRCDWNVVVLGRGGAMFNEILNAVVRRGSSAVEAQLQRVEVEIEPLPLGRRLLDVDNIAEVLAIAEGVGHC
jgi:hypothetical protein